jgi:hypothetical protein
VFPGTCGAAEYFIMEEEGENLHKWLSCFCSLFSTRSRVRDCKVSLQSR